MYNKPLPPVQGASCFGRCPMGLIEPFPLERPRPAMPLLLQGLMTALLLGITSIARGMVAGLLIGILRLYGPLPCA
jgi:hypothetical protein